MKLVNRQPNETADNSRGKLTAAGAIKTALGALIILVLLYLAIGWIGILVGNFIPDRWEKSLNVAKVFGSEEATRSLERPQRVLDRLMKGAELRDLNYRLFWLSMDVPNAVAVPGGGIGVSPALLSSVESDIGLAFILAHELGHHQHRHILRGLGRNLTVSLALSLTIGGDFDSLSAAMNIADSTYSRHHERQADRFGLNLVYQKFGTTKGALEFFEDILMDEKESRLQRYFGSHPLTEERIANLRTLQQELERAN